jgi:competence protein ComEA
MSVFVLACGVVTMFTIRNEPQYIHITPHEITMPEIDESFPKVNLNTATSEELQTLSGIGETRAEAIITYREECGGFSSIEQLMDIHGIGESIFENIQYYIYVD